MIDLEDEQSPVADQGDRETCTGFAVAAGHDWMGGEAEVRSAEDVIWAARQVRPGGREAVAVETALVGLGANEHASEMAWPYGHPRWTSGRPPAALDAANRSELPSWTRLPELSFEVVRDVVDAGNAVVLTIGVVLGAWQEPAASIDSPPGQKAPGNHAVLVVGATEEAEPVEALKIKNSWGSSWAEGGYALLSRRYLEAYGVCAHVIEARR